MNNLKWIFGVVLILGLSLFAHYSLPGRDIVRIVGTDVTRQDTKSSKQTGATPTTKDVRFVNAVWPNGEPRVYRNEDTGWAWPPYFKFDTGNITAQAQAYAIDDNLWVAVTHYGWRIEFLSIFPNAVKIKIVDGPETKLIPWFNIIFFILLAVLAIYIFIKIRAFKRRTIDPVIEDIDTMIDDAGEDIETAKKGFISWLSNLFK
ncbi:MAG: DUF1523 family protein [Hyphomicrobiales bacterium]